MGTWYFWEEYQKALDNLPKKEVKEDVPRMRNTPHYQLDRETQSKSSNLERVSRFFFAVQRMPKAWGSRSWSSHELLRANNTVANDLFRRMMKRELGIR